MATTSFIKQTADDYCLSVSKVQSIYDAGDSDKFYHRLEAELRRDERNSEGHEGTSAYDNWYDEEQRAKRQ